MSKQQSFEAKTKKKAVEEFKVVKVVFSYQSGENGGWRFKEKFIKVPFEANEEQFVQQEIDKILRRAAK